MHKIKISNSKIILINNIGNPPNYTRKYTLEIADVGANRNIENKFTQKVPSHNIKGHDRKDTRLKHNGVITCSNTPATRPNQRS